MITKTDLIEARKDLVDLWGDCGVSVIATCKAQNAEPMSCKDFLDHCTACGGDWGGMLLSGIKELYPDVWEAIPEDMGKFAFNAICCVLMLLGIDTKKGE